MIKLHYVLPDGYATWNGDRRIQAERMQHEAEIKHNFTVGDKFWHYLESKEGFDYHLISNY